MSILLSVVFYGIMFSLNPTLLPVLCRCFKPCHLSSFTLMGPHSDANNYTLRCNKIKSLLITTNAFLVTFNSLLAKNIFVILINCYFIVHVFGIFSFICRPSDITRWCDLAQLTSNGIRSHNLRKIA